MMKKITLLVVTVLLTSIMMAQLPTGSFFEYEFAGGSLANTSGSGAPNLNGSINSITGRDGFANNAANITGALTGASLGPGNENEMTLSFWMKHAPVTSGERIIQVMGVNATGIILNLQNTANITVLSFTAKAGNNFSSTNNTYFAPVNIDDNNWHHITVRTKLNNIYQIRIDIFVDNVMVPGISNKTITHSTSISSFLNSANLAVSPINNYSGDIDDIYFYKTPLTNTQIGDVYNYTPPCNIAIPDANFKAYLVGNTAINTNGNTEIECSEASAFSGTINCASLSISDLTGIEAFTSLTNLTCSDNSLSSLNLSNNITLTDLVCDNNSLNSLDISNNINLSTLNFGHNSLSGLDVSSNTNLINLVCDNNSLGSLNVANGNNSNFISFSAVNNPGLGCIQVDDISYSTANWTNIDGTASFGTNCCNSYVNIPDANFKAYLVGNAAINTNGDTEIQCTEASAFTDSIVCSSLSIADLTGIEFFTGITKLICNYNSLASLDVSQNIALKELDCSNNSLTSIDLSQIIALTELDCSGNPLNGLDVSQNTALIVLSCNSNTLTSLDISQNIALVELGITGNSLTSIDLSQNIALVDLYCMYNNLESLDLSKNTALTRFGLYNNNLSSLNVANGNNTNYTYFGSSYNPNLTCIEVDDVTFSTANWTNKDAQTSFSKNCSGSGSVGINDMAFEGLNIYPNPTSDILNLEIEEALTSIKILDLAGKTIKVFNPESKQLDISEFTAGIYFLEIANAEKKSIVKIVKR